jgi:hypothetical protein
MIFIGEVYQFAWDNYLIFIHSAFLNVKIVIYKILLTIMNVFDIWLFAIVFKYVMIVYLLWFVVI